MLAIFIGAWAWGVCPDAAPAVPKSMDRTATAKPGRYLRDIMHVLQQHRAEVLIKGILLKNWSPVPEVFLNCLSGCGHEPAISAMTASGGTP
jgi:hypothetical protein